MVQVSVEDIRKLREITGAGILDCRTALQEADGDSGKAQAILREKGLASAAKEGVPLRRPRAWSSPTFTAATASAPCSSSTARRTSWPARMSSGRWPTISPCRWRRMDPDASPPRTRARARSPHGAVPSSRTRSKSIQDLVNDAIAIARWGETPGPALSSATPWPRSRGLAMATAIPAALSSRLSGASLARGVQGLRHRAPRPCTTLPRK